nr:hypothetical protein [Tanacetum cinerariifolium]
MSSSTAPPSPDYVPGPEHPSSPHYVHGLDYPKHVAPADNEITIEDQPLHADTSPAALSPGYVTDFDPLEEDPEEDLVDYPVDEGDDDEDEEASEEDEDEEKKHLAPADSATATPPPPPRSPRTKMRAASPLPVPSPPLLLPSVALKDDILKADMPLRKRLCLAALASRFEVKESSTADAARQTGHTLASRVDYRFEDRSTTLEASIKILEDQVRTLQTQHDWIEWQRQQAGDMMTSAFRRIHALEAKDRPHTKDAGPQDGPVDAGSSSSMDLGLYFHFVSHLYWSFCNQNYHKMPPKRTTTLMFDAAIKALVAQSVADALAEHEANRSRNGDDSHDLGSGVVGLTQWFEKMESVFHISNCNVTCQIKFATCTLLGSALTWWNSHFKTIGHDAAYEMTWKTLRKMMTELELMYGRMFPEESNKVEKYADGLPDMIQGSVIESKPKTMQDAIEFATELMDQKIRTFADRQAENKRKLDDYSRNNQTQQ